MLSLGSICDSVIPVKNSKFYRQNSLSVCIPNPCKNDGFCTINKMDINTPVCFCNSRFTGLNCQIENKSKFRLAFGGNYYEHFTNFIQEKKQAY